jgi:tetratricopeptide (TPR) repeat protein
MGKKSKTKSSKRKNAKRSTRADCDKQDSNNSESQTLVSHGEIALSQMQMENALGYYEQALSIDALNSNIMDALADIYLSLGESGRAFELLLKSTQVSPEENPGKYLYIAQLQQGEEALASYTRALHFLTLSRQKSEVGGNYVTKNICCIFVLSTHFAMCIGDVSVGISNCGH